MVTLEGQLNGIDTNIERIVIMVTEGHLVEVRESALTKGAIFYICNK